MTIPTDHNAQPSSASAATTAPALDAIATRNGKNIRIALFCLAIALGAYPGYLLVRSSGTKATQDVDAKSTSETDPITGKPKTPAPTLGGEVSTLSMTGWWLSFLAIEVLGVAFVYLLYDRSGRMSPGERLRFILVLLGGVIGITTAAFGFLLPFTQYHDTFAGGFAEWRKTPSALVWTGLPLFGGLILVFLSLMLTAGLERTSHRARQLLYGYNAIVSAVLLLFIFLLLNVLPYSGVWPFKTLTQTADWTSSQLYSLSQATKERLTKLDKPVKVYVLIASASQISNEVDTLMQNCREVTNQISWESLSPELNPKRVGELVDKYQITDPRGLLVIYGNENEPGTNYDFIPSKDLFSNTSTEETARFVFKGEAALTKALTYLSEGKTKSVVYFTQGNGELDLNDHATERADAGLGEATQKLSLANYEVKPLTFDTEKPKVPDDADIVVVARPRVELPASSVGALRAFATGEGKKKGKLFILLDVVGSRNGKMSPTGLESFLAESGVQVGNERLIVVNSRNPVELMAIPNLRGSNPIARAFAPEGAISVMPFLFSDVRTVSPLPPNPAGPSKYTAESLLLAPALPQQWLVPESDLNADPEAVATQLRSDEDKIRAKVLRAMQSIAVTVSESKNPAPQIPGHEAVRGESLPRMIVFGDAGWISNRAIAGRNGADNYDLFASCVNWLRERPDLGTQVVADKTRAEYRLPPNLSSMRLLLLPVLLILLTVICLGTGVWVVRRR